MECNSCSYHESRDDLLRRLKKIEGQIKGIQKMIEEEKYCVDILIQIAAVRAALNKVGLIILEDHIRGCVAQAMDTKMRDEKISELVDVILKFIK
ncbi:metal-sensitive transcriptional regulator [Thermoanaerobacterium sp. DL9XJH110]|uniref:metal-sensitive transcriptional regulator n=1 Tax=Thermoanaerobacterium sp. DL9XJH110 TaxID=3386643 RepID=UPI003BB52611